MNVMTDAGKQILQMMTAAASILLMGACGVQLWFRLTRLMRGQETADGLAKKQSSIPLRQMAWAAGVHSMVADAGRDGKAQAVERANASACGSRMWQDRS